MSAPKSRGDRILGRMMRMPAALDRRGLRWALNALSPAPMVVLVHRGRRSGRVYRTPVEVFLDDAEQGRLIVAPLYGEQSDWYRNIVAGGLVEVRRDGVGRAMDWRRLSVDEARVAGEAWQEEHPIYSRMILRWLARIHGLEGDLAEAAAVNLPLVALEPPTDAEQPA